MTRGKKASPDPILDALRSAAVDEDLAVAFLETHRWGNKPACPRCGSDQVYRMAGEAGSRDRRWRCRACDSFYTVRTGSALEKSRLPLRYWCHTLWRVSSSRKGVSALQISRELQINYKTALFLMHRLRTAMADTPSESQGLSGTVEIDEIRIGGKPRAEPVSQERRGTNEDPVLGAVERSEELRSLQLQRITARNLKETLTAEGGVDPSFRLMSDEAELKIIGQTLAGSHRANEYVRGDLSDTIERVYSLLKRGIYGIFHSVSRKHLHRYLGEFRWRHNTRKLGDGERAALVVRRAVGKRLLYADQVAGGRLGSESKRSTRPP